jgi:hypothetical protein
MTVTRRIVLGVLIGLAMLCIPAVALSASRSHSFRLPRGPAFKVFTVHVQKTGTLKLLVGHPDVTQASGSAVLVVRLKKAGWPKGEVQIDTGNPKPKQCSAAAGTVYCSASRPDTTAGWYNVIVTKTTLDPSRDSLVITTP